ncbi:hypothetical protein [Ideonella paludis]|uniref:hypothetical protein n=1 Tax=Ideonella paludis TaxID=1233411 RepID=UPI00363F4F97
MAPSARHSATPARAAAPGFARHRRLLAGLVVVVVLAHAGIAWQVAESRIGEGDADTAPKALDVSFVKELMPEAPPVLVAPPPPAAPPAPVVAQADPAASAASAPEPPPQPTTPPPPPVEVAQVRKKARCRHPPRCPRHPIRSNGAWPAPRRRGSRPSPLRGPPPRGSSINWSATFGGLLRVMPRWNGCAGISATKSALRWVLR